MTDPVVDAVGCTYDRVHIFKWCASDAPRAFGRTPPRNACSYDRRFLRMLPASPSDTPSPCRLATHDTDPCTGLKLRHTHLVANLTVRARVVSLCMRASISIVMWGLYEGCVIE
jgi:hypothetical protein